MRKIASSLMAALIVMALLWGNCFSCPQMLLGMQKMKPSHDCCKRGKKPVTTPCDSQGLQHFVKTDDGAAQQAAPVIAEAAIAENPAAPLAAFEARALATPLHSPPDILSLISSFRI